MEVGCEQQHLPAAAWEAIRARTGLILPHQSPTNTAHASAHPLQSSTCAVKASSCTPSRAPSPCASCWILWLVLQSSRRTFHEELVVVCDTQLPPLPGHHPQLTPPHTVSPIVHSCVMALAV